MKARHFVALVCAALALTGCARTSGVPTPSGEAVSVSSFTSTPSSSNSTTAPSPSPSDDENISITISPTPDEPSVTTSPPPSEPVPDDSPTTTKPFDPTPPKGTGKVIREIPSSPEGMKLIALTFDDGPGAYTDDILKVLLDKNAAATFFVVGTEVKRHPEMVKKLVKSGMSVQSHSYAHGDLTSMSDAQILADLELSKKIIVDAGGVEPTCIRPPYGYHNERVNKLAGESDMNVLSWNIDPKDWSRPGYKVIRDNTVSAAMPDGIVVLHDGGGNREQTLKALPGIIDRLHEQGYQFVTVCN